MMMRGCVLYYRGVDSGAILLQADPHSDPHISLEPGPPCSGMCQLTCNCFPEEVCSLQLYYRGNRWWQLCWMWCSGTCNMDQFLETPGGMEGEREGERGRERVEGGRKGGREEGRVEVMLCKSEGVLYWLEM